MLNPRLLETIAKLTVLLFDAGVLFPHSLPHLLGHLITCNLYVPMTS